MLDPMRFDLLLAERRRAAEEAMEMQERLRMLSDVRPGMGRRCCGWLGVRLQAWGVALQRYAQPAPQRAWEEQPSQV